MKTNGDSVRLDRYDIGILKELQSNGRMTKLALARAINLSPSPCWERLKRLEDAGLITGYRAQVDIRKIAHVTEVLVEVTLSGHKAEDFRRFESAIRNAAEITDCWAVGGGADYMMRLVVSDVDAYQRLMDTLLDTEIGIERYVGHIVTKPIKSAPDPLPRT